MRNMARGQYCPGKVFGGAADLMTTRRCQTLFLLILLLGLDLIAAGQQGVSRKPTARAISYGFVSPNTREDLKLEEAIRNLDSGDEDRLVNNARTVACRV